MIKQLYIILFGIVLLSSCAKPIANFVLDQNDTKVPANIQFHNKSEKATSYLWDFGDGNKSTEESPIHKYVLSGNYKVTLIAKKGKKSNSFEKNIFFKAPENCILEMETTEGTMLIKLYDETPKHRDNFIKLAENGYLEGLLFHRVIKGFMVQAGDPKSKNAKKGAKLGSGGPGYTIPAEFNQKYIHKKGALSAARQSDSVNPLKASSGSQFYIVDGKSNPASTTERIAAQKGIHYSVEQKQIYEKIGGTPFLDNEYTVFGEVIKGLDIIDKITAQPTDRSDRPKKDIKIISLKVIK